MATQTRRIGYRITKCKELSFEFKSFPDFKLTERNVSFQYSCSIEQAGDSAIRFIFDVFYSANGEQLFRQKAESIFSIEPIEGAIDFIPDGRVIDHIDIIPTLIGLSYSALRGMISIRTANTPLENFPAPIINAADLAKKMIQ